MIIETERGRAFVAVVEALLGRVAGLPKETLVYCGHEVRNGIGSRS
jgi:hypothetical protein